MDLWDDFWIQKRREWKGKEKGRSEDSCGENSILPKSLSISDSYPIWAKAHACALYSLSYERSMEDGRESGWVATFLVIVVFLCTLSF